ncbi:WD repeat-containing protein 35 [Pectinophora gossypiella]|uniref:WD repeat-containing protein 35 n=1 Tax=Pectinophora gossypiella TaxID=13191 RepID=UPI00214F50DA|nr:WD repeat-containing protein 35 [Pectinophora gossypiella]XP_049867815.1 WD repeat-containing protein 35 [Pectinophora gossypiella]
MFIYMSKKIAIPKQANVTCIAWNHSSGYIAVGGEEGMLKVLKLESGGGGNLSMNLSLEGHTGELRVAVWNEVFQKLTTSDEHGVIIVWMLYKGSWYEEMINNRNKSTVTGMAWGSDGQKICIAYEDGAVIVGGVDGSRVWGKDIKGPGLSAVQWSPDNSLLLFALCNGELHLYDDQGNFMMPVTVQSLAGSMDVVSMDWYPGRAPVNRPVLAICYKSGIILLMKNCIEEDSVVVETNMSAIACHWNHNGSVLAAAGTTTEQTNVVQFFSAYGEHLRTLRVPGGSMRALSWERRSLRLAIAIDSFIYFANVKPDHKYAFYGNTLAFVSSTETVTFWDTVTHQSWINHIPDVIDMCGVEEYCVIATPSMLIISNQQGIQCDAKPITIPVAYVAINSKAVAVAASKESFIIWKFSTPSRPRSTELAYYADGSPITSEGGFQDDTICCITCSDSHLLVGRDSGTILLFSMVNFKKVTSINMNSKPYRLGLNSNSSKFYVIDQPGNLYLLDTDMANNISIGQALRKDVWSALWASDNPQMLAVAEKARLYVMRDTEPEEPLNMQGYLCKFKELEITTALLDNVTDKCTPQHIVRVEVKSLRDTRQLIEKVGLKDAENFIKDNPHPQLWLLLAEAALKNFEAENALETAEAAFVRRNDYAGIRFVNRLNALHSNALKKAEILAYFKDFDAAEKIYHNEDRRDLAIALRKRLGHWFRIVELLKMSPSTTEAQVKQAYSNIGDYYIDRQNWTSALEYYTMSNNTEGLKKCYMALEDNESLAKLIMGSPRISKEASGRQSVVDDISDGLTQTPSIQSILQLKESGRMLQAAAMAFQLANLEASKKSSPLRIKKLYILAGHIYSQSTVEGSSSREALRSFKLAAAQHWLWLAAARALARPPRADAALRAAARLRADADLLHPAQHVQTWCTIAAIAVQARAFDLCSKAFIKLEALDQNAFENLAIEIFSRCKPKDSKGNKIDCPNCHVSIPEWSASCGACASQFPGCAVSARALLAPLAVWSCPACGARAHHHELVLRHSCPMCHAQLS